VPGFAVNRLASANRLDSCVPAGDASAMNTHVNISPWRGVAIRPFAPSLERLRLQTYLLMALCDLMIIMGSFMISGALREGNFLLPTAMRQALLLMPMFAALALYNRTYSAQALTRASFAISRVISAIMLATGLLLFVTFYAKMSEDFSRIAFTVGTTLSILLMSALRIFIVRYVRSNWGPGAQNVLIIDDGGPKVASPHAYTVNVGDNRLDIGFDDPRALDRLGRYVENMDRVIVSCPMEKRKHWAFFLRAAGIDGEVVTEVGRELGAIGLRQHKTFTSMIVSAKPLNLRNRAVKRFIDFGVAALSLIVLAPLLLVVALLIKLQDGGPVFFVQRRMGRGNRFFGMYKFRSMTVARSDADGVQSASRDDDRITPIGRIIRKTSIDELPQLLNVLKGDMSLVGPRPHALGSQAGEKLFWEVDVRYWHRHSLRPGLTGLAQIRGYRGATDCEMDLSMRLQADLEYIANWSPWRDLYIMLLTVRVLVHEKAF
jgi:polysaccharide biosynthesis protein PslA